MEKLITLIKPNGVSSDIVKEYFQKELNIIGYAFVFENKNDIKDSDMSFLFENINNFKIPSSLQIDDLWMLKKNVYILNKRNKEKFNIDNLLIGEFDLIHKGHIKLLSNKNISILTFLNNPKKTDLVNNINQRVKELEKFNPKYIFVYDISNNNISAEEFIKEYLMKINPKKIYVGEGFKFGKNASGDSNLLKKHFNLIEIKRDNDYSTEKVKSLIKQNDFKDANDILNEDFAFENIVIGGKKLGRKLGFPTANIIINSKFLFNEGSYASKTILKNIEYNSISFLVRINSESISLETHIFDFDADIYGQQIKVIPKFFIRKAEKFNNQNDLIESIKKDIRILKEERNNYGK